MFIELKGKIKKNLKSIRFPYSKKINLNLFFIIDFVRKIRFFSHRFHHPYINLGYKRSKRAWGSAGAGNFQGGTKNEKGKAKTVEKAEKSEK